MHVRFEIERGSKSKVWWVVNKFTHLAKLPRTV